jgi:hypothetical protein
LYVQNNFWKAFVKYPGLDLKRGLRRLEIVFEASQGGERSGRQIDAIAERKQPRHHHEDGDHAQERPHAQTAGAHCRDFAVRGQATEPDQDADQHAHGDGVGEGDRDGEEKYFRHAGERGAVAHDKFQNAAEVVGEKNEG